MRLNLINLKNYALNSLVKQKKIILIYLLIMASYPNIIAAQEEEKSDDFVIINNYEEGLWANDESKKLKIEEIFSIGILEGNDNYIFSSITDVAIYKDSVIFICDYGDKCIKVYDKTGNFIRRIGRKGRGPGEFLYNLSIEIDQSEKLYVLDTMTNHRISIFDLNGNYIDSFILQTFNARDIKINNDNIITISVAAPHKENYNYIIHHYNKNGKLIKSYGTIVNQFNIKNTPIMLNSAIPYFDISLTEELYCAFDYPYLIKVYSNGKLNKIIQREYPEFTDVRFVNRKGLSIPYPAIRSFIKSIFILPNGKFILFVADYGKDYIKKLENSMFNESIKYKLFINLFDENGKFLKTYPYNFEKYGSVIYIDNNGYFYTRSKNGIPMLTKYQFSFE